MSASWQATIQLRSLYEDFDEDPGLVKDDEVFRQLHVLALEWKHVRHLLRQAGLGPLVSPPSL